MFSLDITASMRKGNECPKGIEVMILPVIANLKVWPFTPLECPVRKH